MKQIVLFAIINLLNNYSYSQLISSDKNWNSTPVFIDDFTPPHTPWNEIGWNDYPDLKWASFLITAGVTHGDFEHQVYNYKNAIFNASDSSLILRADTASPAGQNITNYEIPPGYERNTALNNMYYYSGAINSIDFFKYGYFETRCKIPVQAGAFPAFWLYFQDGGHYREIDIFERMTILGDGGIVSGIWMGNHHPPERVNNFYYYDSNLTGWHTWGFEWSPKRAIWYCDNKIIGSFFSDSVPQYLCKLF